MNKELISHTDKLKVIKSGTEKEFDQWRATALQKGIRQGQPEEVTFQLSLNDEKETGMVRLRQEARDVHRKKGSRGAGKEAGMAVVQWTREE